MLTLPFNRIAVHLRIWQGKTRLLSVPEHVGWAMTWGEGGRQHNLTAMVARIWKRKLGEEEN